MSRLTGTDAKGLLEAYSAVYASQELTEEQVWEEVETWVNSLLEEGYDLSDYTWEEMYEEYLLEYGENAGLGYARSPKEIERMKDNKPYVSPFARPRNVNTTVRNSATGEVLQKPKMGGINDPKYRGQELQQAARAKASQVKPTTPTTPTTTTPTTTTPPPKPAAGAPAAAAKPAAQTGPTGKPLVGGIERRTPTRAEMDAAKAYRTPAATTGTLGAATAAASTPAAFGSAPIAARPISPSTTSVAFTPSTGNLAARPVAPVPAAKPTPTPVSAAPKPSLQDKIRQQRLNMSFDVFDVVLGHLIDEGYADTQEAAIAIMSNMSEEWRDSIVDEVLDEELTGERLARADAKRQSLGRKKSTRDARVALDRVARGLEGTGTDGGRKAPTKRGGGGTKGQTKTSGAGGADDDRGDGNRAARRAGTYRTPMW